MSNTDTKRCGRCGAEKPRTDFYKCRTFADGLQYRCKPCTREVTKAHNASPKGRAWFAARARRLRAGKDAGVFARKYISEAVRHGRMPAARALRCSACGTAAEQYHHHKGYERPNHRVVTPLCGPCHRKADSK